MAGVVQENHVERSLSEPPSVHCPGPSSALCLQPGMDWGNEDGSRLQDFRAVCPLLMAVLTAGGFYQDTRIITSWDRSIRACPHRGPCPLFLQLSAGRLCNRCSEKCNDTGLAPAPSTAVPLPLGDSVSRHEPATPSAFPIHYTKSPVLYYWWLRIL